MKKIYISLFVLLPFLSVAQPAGYYDPAIGTTGQALRAALSTIIRPHTELTYTPGVWDAIATTDRKPSGKVWDIYSDIPGGTPSYQFTYVTQQCGSTGGTVEGFCYNREHSWPQSKFTFPNANNTPGKTDLFLVYPTDYLVNNRRGDNPYGKVGTASQTFTNGSKLGNNVYPGAPSGTCFEPIDSFKGDLARSYFYVSTCYRNDSMYFTTWEMATLVALKPWAAQMLLEWHHNDPVSKKELDRNNAVYALQGNRNPFIDHPEYADCIWGTANCSTTAVAANGSATEQAYVYPNPANGQVHISWQYAAARPAAINVHNIAGQVVYTNNSTTGNELTINVANWASGVYYIQLITANTVQVQKVVVE
jgi:endonuclease I